MGITLLSLLVFVTAAVLTFIIMTKDAKLDETKLLSAESNITVLDGNGEEITGAFAANRRKCAEAENLGADTVNAFIASEDRTFYKHNGLNFKRMVKAAYKNVISRSFKEGASTISQQLIKNTHLSGDKTISRKMNEIKLTLQLEKNYSKNEILEMYLNTIYFGHNCFGIQSAAEFYFNKSAENLTLEESAVLAGLLSSPNNYSPLKNPQKCAERRNIVLKAMANCGFITQTRCNEAINSPIVCAQGKSQNQFGDYIDAVFGEIEDKGVDVYKLTEGCKIYTRLNAELQERIENCEYPCDSAVIVTDISGGVSAYKSDIGGAKRQPGSTIKPLAVYAPAIEEKLISPYTKILDEKIDYDGYSPENHDKIYHGYVTAADSLKLSYNVPAVKTLNALTFDRAEKYLKSMDIELEEDEKNLSLALGGMKYGLTIKQIADSYSSFARLGTFSPSLFVDKIITDDGKVLYQSSQTPKKVFSDGACSLMNGMLIETSKSGTAKKLKNLNYDVASKTGTCGNESGNTDAYSVCYTSENCVCVWLGDKNNNRTPVTGGKDCCALCKIILNELYSSHKPQNLETEKGTEKINIDAEEYNNNNKIILADKNSPAVNILSVKTLLGNIPREISTRFTHPTVQTPEISVLNDVVNIKLCHTKYYSYIVKRIKNSENEVIYDEKWKSAITDSPESGIYTYSVTPYYFDGKNKYYGDEIILGSVIVGNKSQPPQIKIPDIANRDWYNM